MEYSYSGTESWWYGSLNHHVCRKGKCAADRPSRSTGVDPSRKQMYCSQSCVLSQAQRDTSDLDNSQNLDYWLTILYRCIDMWSWTEMLSVSLQPRAKTVWILMSDRNMSARRGAQLVLIGMPTICWKTFSPRTTKMLSTRNSSMLIMSSSVHLLFESECSLTKYGPSRPKTTHLYLRFLFLWVKEFRMIVASLLFSFLWVMVV